jgi:hypothetical protein
MARVVTMDSDDTTVSTDKTVIAADGVESCAVTVSVKQSALDPLTNDNLGMPGMAASNVVITVTPSTGVTITQPTGVTSQGGSASGAFISTNAATVTVGATVLGVPVGAGTTVVVGGGAPPTPPEGDPFYTTSFAVAGVPSGNNADGFTWNGPKNTECVTFDSRTALRLRYVPGGGGTQQAEQRFNMGRDCANVWLEYDMFVPANFAHPNEAPSNNKFLMIWNTTYGSGSGTWQAGYEYLRATGTSSNLRPMSSKEFGTNASFVTSAGLNHPDNNAPFIGSSNPLVPGTWNQLRLQFSRSSAGGESDGIIRLMVNGVMIAEMTNGPFRNLDNIGDTVLRNGYFMGTANALFTEQTDWYITDVSFYDTNPGWEGFE